MKNLTSGENNFSDVHEELAYIDFPPVSGKTILPQIFLKQLLQRLYSVHALRPRAAYFFLLLFSHFLDANETENFVNFHYLAKLTDNIAYDALM